MKDQLSNLSKICKQLEILQLEAAKYGIDIMALAAITGSPDNRLGTNMKFAVISDNYITNLYSLVTLSEVVSRNIKFQEKGESEAEQTIKTILLMEDLVLSKLAKNIGVDERCQN
jgi:hypothetical protein